MGRAGSGMVHGIRSRRGGGFGVRSYSSRHGNELSRRGTAERGNDVNLLFTFQPRMTEQGERRINQPPGDPPGGKNTGARRRPRRGRGSTWTRGALHHPLGGGEGTRGTGAVVGQHGRDGGRTAAVFLPHWCCLSGHKAIMAVSADSRPWRPRPPPPCTPVMRGERR